MDGRGSITYNFETMNTEEVRALEEVTESDSVVEDVGDVCACGNCLLMPTLEENVCCQGSDFVVGDMETLTCITEHAHFETLVLTDAVLQVAFIQIMALEGSRERAPETLTNEQSRLSAYRQFICWMRKGGKLGYNNIVAIPSCVVSAIRQKFPSHDGSYTGFETAVDNMRELF